METENTKIPVNPNYPYLQHAESSLKAHVFIGHLSGNHVVIKDYSQSSRLVRSTLCRLLIHREIKALKRASNIDGVPKYIGRVGKFAFAIQAIDGQQLTPELARGNCSLFKQLEQRVCALHRQGITHNDLHLRNLLLDSKGVLYVVDFAAAYMRPTWLPKRSLSGLIFSITRATDRAKVARLKSKFCDWMLTDEDQQIIKKTTVVRRLRRLRPG